MFILSLPIMFLHINIVLGSSLFLLFSTLPTLWAVVCEPGFGTAIGDDVNCFPCIDGETFSAQTDSKPCELCIKKEFDPYVEEIAPCRPDRDTVFKCRRDDTFYDPDHNTCRLCTKCKPPTPFVAQACDSWRNAVCSSCKEAGLVPKDGGCVEPVLCSVKERLIYARGSDGGQDSCEPCPENFTNYDKHHAFKSCETPCVDVNEADVIEQKILNRSLSCAKEEMLGKSCYDESIVFCRPESNVSETTDHVTENKKDAGQKFDEDDQDADRNNEELDQTVKAKGDKKRSPESKETVGGMVYLCLLSLALGSSLIIWFIYFCKDAEGS